MSGTMNYASIILFLLILFVISFLSMFNQVLLKASPPKSIVLVYSDSRKGFYMTKDQLLSLVVYFNDSKAVDTFFDGFLFLGIIGPSGGSYETGTANDEDWKWLIDRLLESGNQVKNLQEAAEEASKLLGKKVTLKVIIVIPLPSRSLSFQERLVRVKNYVDKVITKFYSHNFTNLELEGFYWMCETAPIGDRQLVKEVCNYVHEKRLKMYWIPYFNAQGYDQWKELGFDYVMLQPNFAFYDVTLQRFSEVDEKIRKYNLSVEMELATYIRNPNLKDWKQSFIVYLYHSLHYKWYKLKPVSYYYANAFYQIYKNERKYYNLLYKHVKGTLTLDEISKEYNEAVNYTNRKIMLFLVVSTFTVIIGLIILLIVLKKIKH